MCVYDSFLSGVSNCTDVKYALVTLLREIVLRVVSSFLFPVSLACWCSQIRPFSSTITSSFHTARDIQLWQKRRPMRQIVAEGYFCPTPTPSHKHTPAHTSFSAIQALELVLLKSELLLVITTMVVLWVWKRKSLSQTQTTARPVSLRDMRIWEHFRQSDYQRMSCCVMAMQLQRTGPQGTSDPE